MLPKRTIVRNERGVVLMRVDRTGALGPAVISSWELSTLRTQERRSFGSLGEAEAAFEIELKRSLATEGGGDRGPSKSG